MTPEHQIFPSPPDPPATPEARERTVQLLGRHFADDRISLDELERRLELVYKAQSIGELDRLVSDLGPTTTSVTAPGPAPLLARPEDVPERGKIVAILSGNFRRGRWVVPRHFRVVAVLGGVQIDLREAQFIEGVTEIDVTAVLGGVELLIPPGVHVQSEGGAFLGGFETDQESGPGSSRVVVRLTGMAVLGGVSASTRPAPLPGAPAETPRIGPSPDSRRRVRGD